MEHEDPQVGGAAELLLDPAVPSAADLPVVEVGLRRVDGDDGHAVHVQHGVPFAEQLLEMDVADVPRVVVPGHDDEGLALDPVKVGLGLGELLLEPEGRQVARADDEIGTEVVDLADRALHQAGHEMRTAAVDVRDVRDLEDAVGRRHGRSVRSGRGHGAYPKPLLS